jgi:multidrug efflux system membrane fusion protein
MRSFFRISSSTRGCSCARLEHATTAPVAAIQHGAPGTFVFLIRSDNSVAVQKIGTGVTEGDRIQIVSGLKPGDTVVVADRLRDGSKVRIVPDQDDTAADVNNGPALPRVSSPTTPTRFRSTPA